jgi:hypothetical protein
MYDGKKIVERIPAEWAEEVKGRVDAGRRASSRCSDLRRRRFVCRGAEAAVAAHGP